MENNKEKELDIRINSGGVQDMDNGIDTNGVDVLSYVKSRLNAISRIIDVEKKLELMSNKLDQMIKSIDTKMSELSKQ